MWQVVPQNKYYTLKIGFCQEKGSGEGTRRVKGLKGLKGHKGLKVKGPKGLKDGPKGQEVLSFKSFLLQKQE